MINFIPIFPLSLVVYPGEALHLHIFEPRYIQLINECVEQSKSFGIPVVLNNHVAEHGTLVKVEQVVKQYEDGKMDIITRGLSVFRVLEIVKEVPDKLYYGAIVDYPYNQENRYQSKMQKIISAIKELHRLMNISKEFKKAESELMSYDVAHHAGLSLEEEYELLGLMREDQRLEYLKRHLQKVIPMVAGLEALKEKIKLNGHFKELKGFNFDF